MQVVRIHPKLRLNRDETVYFLTKLSVTRGANLATDIPKAVLSCHTSGVADNAA